MAEVKKRSAEDANLEEAKIIESQRRAPIWEDRALARAVDFDEYLMTRDIELITLIEAMPRYLTVRIKDRLFNVVVSEMGKLKKLPLMMPASVSSYYSLFPFKFT